MAAEPAYVPNMSAAAPMTAEQFLHVSIPDKRVELVKGVVVVREPPGYQHGRVAANLAYELLAFVKRTESGKVLVGDAGFTLARGPDTVRGPDVAFVRRDRIPDPEPRGFAEFGPDLVIEVRSPGDRPGELLAKVADWLNAGSQLVWVIDPARRQAHVYRADGTESLVSDQESLDGAAVLPGFRCPLATIL